MSNSSHSYSYSYHRNAPRPNNPSPPSNRPSFNLPPISTMDNNTNTPGTSSSSHHHQRPVTPPPSLPPPPSSSLPSSSLPKASSDSSSSNGFEGFVYNPTPNIGSTYPSASAAASASQSSSGGGGFQTPQHASFDPHHHSREASTSRITFPHHRAHSSGRPVYTPENRSHHPQSSRSESRLTSSAITPSRGPRPTGPDFPYRNTTFLNASPKSINTTATTNTSSSSNDGLGGIGNRSRIGRSGSRIDRWREGGSDEGGATDSDEVDLDLSIEIGRVIHPHPPRHPRILTYGQDDDSQHGQGGGELGREKHESDDQDQQYATVKVITEEPQFLSGAERGRGGPGRLPFAPHSAPLTTSSHHQMMGMGIGMQHHNRSYDSLESTTPHVSNFPPRSAPVSPVPGSSLPVPQNRSDRLSLMPPPAGLHVEGGIRGVHRSRSSGSLPADYSSSHQSQGWTFNRTSPLTQLPSRSNTTQDEFLGSRPRSGGGGGGGMIGGLFRTATNRPQTGGSSSEDYDRKSPTWSIATFFQAFQQSGHRTATPSPVRRRQRSADPAVDRHRHGEEDDIMVGKVSLESQRPIQQQPTASRSAVALLSGGVGGGRSRRGTAESFDPHDDSRREESPSSRNSLGRSDFPTPSISPPLSPIQSTVERESLQSTAPSSPAFSALQGFTPSPSSAGKDSGTTPSTLNTTPPQPDSSKSSRSRESSVGRGPRHSRARTISRTVPSQRSANWGSLGGMLTSGFGLNTTPPSGGSRNDSTSDRSSIPQLSLSLADDSIQEAPYEATSPRGGVHRMHQRPRTYSLPSPTSARRRDFGTWTHHNQRDTTPPSDSSNNVDIIETSEENYPVASTSTTVDSSEPPAFKSHRDKSGRKYSGSSIQILSQPDLDRQLWEERGYEFIEGPEDGGTGLVAGGGNGKGKQREVTPEAMVTSATPGGVHRTGSGKLVKSRRTKSMATTENQRHTPTPLSISSAHSHAIEARPLPSPDPRENRMSQLSQMSALSASGEYDSVPLSKLFFFLGIFLQPWMFVLGGWWLSPHDGTLRNRKKRKAKDSPSSSSPKTIKVRGVFGSGELHPWVLACRVAAFTSALIIAGVAGVAVWALVVK